MNTEEIQKYIDRINTNTHHDTIFLRPINNNVYVSRVWDENPIKKKEIQNKYGSHTFFFIKNENDFIVGAVLDMINDLHWYTSPENRKKGYLTKALKEVIIPYLFCNDFDDRNEQKISIKRSEIGDDNYFSSKKVAENVGFKAINNSETQFVLTSDNFDWSEHDEIQNNTLINKERFEFLISKLDFIKLNLKMLDDELTMKCNDDSFQMILRDLETISIISIMDYGNDEIKT